MRLFNSFLGMACASALLCGATAAQALPETGMGTGVVTSASGVWAGFVGSTVDAMATFDLDETNAYAKELIAPSGETPFYRWTYNSATPFMPYGAMFSGLFGSFTSGTVRLETLDDFDADAAGNPFGLTGIIDVLSIASDNVVDDCSAGVVDPVTGCSDPDAPYLGGTEFQVHLVGGSDWFTGNDVLPLSQDAPTSLGAFGQGELYAGETVIGSMEIDFNTSVAEPAALGLFGLGLAGVGLAARRRAR
jgi:hypothetical protein